MRTTISWDADGPFDAAGKISISMCSAALLDGFIRSWLQFTAGPVFFVAWCLDLPYCLVLCSSIWLLNFTRNIAPVKAVRRPGVTMATCIWHYQMSLSSRAHHIQNGLSFFPSAAIFSQALLHPYMSDCTFIHKSTAETHQREINRIWRPTDTYVALTSKH